MPEIKLPEVKLPGLREMSPDDIRHALSEARPDVKLSDFDPRKVELPKIDLSKIDLSKIDLSKIDLAGAAAAAAASAADRNPLRRKRRSRMPMVLFGLVLAGLTVFTIANIEWLRSRVAGLTQRARTRMDAEHVSDSLQSIRQDEASFGGSVGTVGIPIEPDAYSETSPAETSPAAINTPSETIYGSAGGDYVDGSPPATADEDEARSLPG